MQETLENSPIYEKKKLNKNKQKNSHLCRKIAHRKQKQRKRKPENKTILPSMQTLPLIICRSSPNYAENTPV